MTTTCSNHEPGKMGVYKSSLILSRVSGKDTEFGLNIESTERV